MDACTDAGQETGISPARDAADRRALPRAPLDAPFAASAPDADPDDAGIDPVAAGMLGTILAEAVRDGASDVHLEPQADHLRVRCRVDGTLRAMRRLPASCTPAVMDGVRALVAPPSSRPTAPCSGRFTIDIDGRSVGVRVSLAATICGETAVLRLVDRQRGVPSLDELGMRPELLGLYRQLARSPSGMLLCCGPAGSGRTTTMYATLAEIARPEVNAMTIENPVEATLASINQMQVDERSGLTFASGLRAILEHDADMIAVGEIADGETAQIAVRAALVGRLVLGSIHGTESASALVQLAALGVRRAQVAGAVIGVVAQRLVRRVCAACGATYQPSDHELSFFEACGGDPDRELVRGAGCDACGGTGYRGRTGVFEIMLVSDSIRALLHAGATPQQMRAAAREEGMATLQFEGVALVHSGVTTIDEILRTIYVT